MNSSSIYKGLFLLCASSCALLLTACFPWPHYTTCSPEIDGRLIDAKTHAPIAGGQINLEGHPSTKTTSDKTGNFHFRRHFDFVFLEICGICGSEWPEPDDWGNKLEIINPGYRKVTTVYSNFDKKQGYKLDDEAWGDKTMFAHDYGDENHFHYGDIPMTPHTASDKPAGKAQTNSKPIEDWKM